MRPTGRHTKSTAGTTAQATAATQVASKQGDGRAALNEQAERVLGARDWSRIAAAAACTLPLVFSTVFFLSRYESSFPRCNAHSDCKKGEFCRRRLAWGQLDPGACFDCYAADWVLQTNNTQKEQGEYTGRVSFKASDKWEYTGRKSIEAGDKDYWNGAAKYCADTDTMPLRCNHLVANRNALSGGGVLVLAFAAILALIPTVQDLDQTADEAAVVASRAMFVKIELLTRALLYITHRARVFIVPA